MYCENHRDREATFVCQKYSVGYCQECCACPNPQTYCKFRSGCIIWEMCECEEGVP
ncbi:MAG: hypothetical protein ACUVXI_13340 [bacterium]